jgi:hypothetical protein
MVYRDVTRQAKGLYHLKHVGALRNGLAYLSRYNSGWFCHTGHERLQGVGQMKEDDEGIRFHTLRTVGMHRGGQIWPEKRWRRVCSWVAVLFVVVDCRGERVEQE